MSEQEKSNEQEDSNEKLSLLGQLVEANASTDRAFSDYTRQLQQEVKKKFERLEQRRGTLDNELLKGTISQEQAAERLKQLREERKELFDEVHEGMQFIAQAVRDSKATQELHVKRFMEKHKLDYDFHKHFTTLGTGSILFIAAVLRLIFPEISETEGLGLLFASFVLLILSVLAAALAMKASTLHVAMGESLRLTERLADNSWFLFTTGIVGFVWYLAINLTGTTVEREWLLPLFLIGASLLGILLPTIVRYLARKVGKFTRKDQQ